MSCYLRAEMSKSNAHNLLDLEEQHWQRTTNFAKREIGKMYHRSDYDILNINVRNLGVGWEYTKRIFIETGLSCNKAAKDSSGHPGYFNSTLCLRKTMVPSSPVITELSVQHAGF